MYGHTHRPDLEIKESDGAESRKSVLSKTVGTQTQFSYYGNRQTGKSTLYHSLSVGLSEGVASLQKKGAYREILFQEAFENIKISRQAERSVCNLSNVFAGVIFISGGVLRFNKPVKKS